MSFRVSALVAAAAVFGSSSLAPAQPVVPARPRTSGFSAIFTPGQQQQLLLGNNFAGPLGLGGVGGLGGPFVGPGLGNPAFMGAQGAIGYPGGLAYPQVLPGALAVNPQLPASGVVGTFNNLGHWYGRGYGNYGHWYPNGIRSGRGALGLNTGGFGGGGGLYGPGGGFGGPGVGGAGSAIGQAGGAALGLGATINQFRR
jgi:hypothetical protein